MQRLEFWMALFELLVQILDLVSDLPFWMLQ